METPGTREETPETALESCMGAKFVLVPETESILSWVHMRGVEYPILPQHFKSQEAPDTASSCSPATPPLLPPPHIVPMVPLCLTVRQGIFPGARSIDTHSILGKLDEGPTVCVPSQTLPSVGSCISSASKRASLPGTSAQLTPNTGHSPCPA